ncbi:MAG TPA: HD domain-containing phosphohydrolase [Dehalococcoidia bacterium]|nr:HD domain-containing phosphohydrolase [Dehalococcoidia bacterium]
MKALPALAKLALGATQQSPAADTLVEALEIIRRETGAVAALVFYGEHGEFQGAAANDDATRYPKEPLAYLQQRLLQLRVPLTFNLEGNSVRYITRAANKQQRDYVAWLIPAADSWTEMLMLRGSWPSGAVGPLLEFVDSAMPALTIMLERFVGVGRTKRLERQLSTISDSVELLDRSAEVIGSVAAAYPALHGLPEEQVQLLTELAHSASDALEEVRANRDLMESHLRLQEYTARLERAVQEERQQAATDALTGLMNHRGALQSLGTALDAAQEAGRPLSLLMGDIDGFKLFNDTYGHVLGDSVLRLVADVARNVVGSAGTLCRYGGDEFLIILHDHTKDAATAIAANIAQTLGKSEFRGEDGTLVPVRMSMGIATYPDDATSSSQLVAQADAAMYASKRQTSRTDGESVISTSSDGTFGVLDSLVQAVDAKDSYTKRHCDIVAEYAVKLARHMNLPEESQRALRIAGLLHDIGKLAVPDEILKKPGPLNEEEYEIMQRHVTIGEVLIREVPELKEVLQAIACHHERYDGTGYPRQLKGDGIPLIGRIIAIADAYSAMCLDRPYRKGMSHDRVLKELVAAAGYQFDPEITKQFVELLLAEQLERQRAEYAA